MDLKIVAVIGLEVSPKVKPEYIEGAAASLDRQMGGRVVTETGTFFRHQGVVFRIAHVRPSPPAKITSQSEMEVGYGDQYHFEPVSLDQFTDLKQIPGDQAWTSKGPEPATSRVPPEEAPTPDVSPSREPKLKRPPDLPDFSFAPLFPVPVLIKERRLFGYVDSKGDMVIRPRFMDAHPFTPPGLALVGVMNKGFGYIDMKGDVAIQPGFQTAMPFGPDGLAAVEVAKNRWGFIDTRGKRVISPDYDFVRDFNEGLAAVKVGKKFGCIDTRGHVVIKPQHDRMESFADGRAAVVKYGVLDKGKEKWGYIDREGREVIKIRYESARGFCSSLAPVQRNGKWGFIDTEGKQAIAFRFDCAARFSEGLAAVEINRRMGFVDRTGELVIDHQFIGLGLNWFSEGLLPARPADGDKKYAGYIDRSGNWAIEPRFDKAHDFRCGCAIVNVKGKKWLINREGKPVWKEK